MEGFGLEQCRLSILIALSPSNFQASTPRGSLRLGYLRANSRLSSQEQAVEEFLRSNAPARFVQYEALQQTAETGWKQTAEAELCVGAVARVRGYPFTFV